MNLKYNLSFLIHFELAICNFDNVFRLNCEVRAWASSRVHERLRSIGFVERSAPFLFYACFRFIHGSNREHGPDCPARCARMYTRLNTADSLSCERQGARSRTCCTNSGKTMLRSEKRKFLPRKLHSRDRHYTEQLISYSDARFLRPWNQAVGYSTRAYFPCGE